MRLVPVWALRPGMEVARKISCGTGAPLLNAGVRLQADYIRKLKKMEIRAIYIHDDLIPDVEIEDVILEETRDKAIGMVRSALVEIRDSSQGNFSRLLAVKRELSAVLDDIIGQLLTSKDLTVNLSDIRFTDDYTFAHSVNVAILSIMNAISLGLSKRELNEVGMGAFLHDMGKVVVPLPILNKPGMLSEAEMNEIKKHPRYGMDLVRARDIASQAVLSVIYQHHERIDGSGYPQGLRGDELEIFPRICAVADVYDALVSDRPYRAGYLPHRAMDIMECECAGYDLKILQTFFHHIAAYPVGTIVGLNNGLIGVVVQNAYGHPRRPRVRIFCSRDNFAPLDAHEIDLVETLNLVIDRIYLDDEIPDRIRFRKTS